MKKILLVAALGVAGIMSANTPIENSSEPNFELEEVKVEWCGTIMYSLSCGIKAGDSWCESWGDGCITTSYNTLNYLYCGVEYFSNPDH